ncbi:hypothetical protein H9P43_002761 [Blastocladiella emersonii ATCC 22665]|nr:hypothetical protein H9P43_002761 [Blastocladiella emersonii ATCC 22665]
MPTKVAPTTGLRAGFVSVPEQREPIKLPVAAKSGTTGLPSWLAGALYRMGPVTFDAGDVQIRHWFDGFSMVHRFEITADGKVWYRNRRTSSDIEAKVAAQGSFSGFGPADPCKSLFKRITSTFLPVAAYGAELLPTTDTVVNVTVTPTRTLVPPTAALPPSHGQPGGFRPDRPYLAAKTDYRVLQLLDPVTLDPVTADDGRPAAMPASRFSYTDLHPGLRGELSAAHHQEDPVTGDVYQFLVDPAGTAPTLCVFHLRPDLPMGGRVLATVPLEYASYMHSFSMTKRHLVFIVQPYYLGWFGAKALLAPSLFDALEWDPKRRATFLVIDRASGAVVRQLPAADPLFAFHTINAWDVESRYADEPEAIELEVCGYDHPGIVRRMMVDAMCPTLRETSAVSAAEAGRVALSDLATLRRYLIPLRDEDASAGVRYTQIGPARGLELPRFHSGRAGLPTRFVYGLLNALQSSKAAGWMVGLAKVDTVACEQVEWSALGMHPGEPVFVPRPGATDEDDGVVLSVVLDTQRGTSFLLVLDARLFTEVARAEVPSAVPIGFHGSFLGATAEMDSFN